MHRITTLSFAAVRPLARRQVAAPAASAFALRHKSANSGQQAVHDVGIDSNPAPQDKSHADAKKGHAQPEPNSEGHSQDKTHDAQRFQDAHTEELTKAGSQRKNNDMSPGPDAINQSHGSTGGQAEKQRKAHATPEGSKFQPGQQGEQVGGHANTSQGPVEGEGMSGTKKAPSIGTGGGVGDVVKNIFGGGPTNGFHTFARASYPAVPDEAVEKGARKQKDTGVGAEQTPHLPHHQPGEGDKMPAVQDNASLPSKQGNAKDIPSKKQVDKDHSGKGTNIGAGPSSELRPTGTKSTPGSRAVDPSTSTHSPSVSPRAGPQATYTHVIGNPEPDSHQINYQYSSKTPSGAIPSGSNPRSSTSTSTYSGHTTDGILKNEAGIGSSNEMIKDPLKGADQMVEMQEVGQAGDDAGGRGAQPQSKGGRVSGPPPDLAEIEDTLPKPIKN